jgi:penicillin-binding protein 1A
MAGRRRTGERREPVFDATPAAGGEGRAAPAVRSPTDERAPQPRKSGTGRKTPRKRRRRRSGIRIGRIVYWGAVVSLWLVIAAIGTVIWIGAHLPPIQSLEIPKRPPTIKIVDLQAISSPRAATWAVRRCR